MSAHIFTRLGPIVLLTLCVLVATFGPTPAPVAASTHGENLAPGVQNVAGPDAMAPEATLNWAGYTWTIRSGTGNPGNNNWSPNNVWKDSSGNLHLRFTRNGSYYAGAELSTQQRFTFGKFQWWVDGSLDQLHRNLVLGLFLYDDEGMDGRNEIDIEYARWGNRYGNPGNFAVYPATKLSQCSVTGWNLNSLGGCVRTFPVSLYGTYTTQRFTWRSTSVYFQALNGFRNDDLYPIMAARYNPGNYTAAVPQRTLKVHMNLWLSGNVCPTDLPASTEVVLKSFAYTP